MTSKARYVELTIIAAIISFLLLGWANCTSKRISAGKMKTVRAYTEIAKTSIRWRMQNSSHPSSVEYLVVANDYGDYCDKVAHRAVDAFFTEEGKNPHSFPNPYNRKLPGYSREPLGNEPGTIYMDFSKCAEGEMDIVGVYLDPGTGKPAQFIEALRIPGDPAHCFRTPGSPQVVDTSLNAQNTGLGESSINPIQVSSLDEAFQWIRLNDPAASIQRQERVVNGGVECVVISLVREDGTHKGLFFWVKR